MQSTMRWFGPHDAVSLEQIRQAGATGVVSALHHIPPGDIWPVEEIRNHQEIIRQAGLEWVVVESLPVHEHIKQGRPERDNLFSNYIESLHNLASCGIRRVVYNFMPVLDWVRTEHNFLNKDGTSTLEFKMEALIYFDLAILKRENAHHEYSETEIRTAEKYGEELDDTARKNLTSAVLLGLPGAGGSFDLSDLRQKIGEYSHINHDTLRDNLVTFLRAVCPAANSLGTFLSIHPDDPPFPVLGLPRIASEPEDFRYIFSQVPDPSNTMCFCTGSLGANERVNLPELAAELSSRIQFIHLRNVIRSSSKNFRESDHLFGDVPMLHVMSILLGEISTRKESIPMRPDHGVLMQHDSRSTYYPGYSYSGRMKALAELRGAEMALLAQFNATS